MILATKRFASDSTIRSWWCILSTLFLAGGAAAGTLLAPTLLLKLVCSVFYGLLILRLFVIYHDQQHHAILPRSNAAESLMRILGIVILSPSSIWRSSHNYHHNHNSRLSGAHVGSFPIMTAEQFRKSTPKERRLYLFIRHPLTILFGYLFMFLFGMCLNPFLSHPRKHFDGLIALVVHFALGLALVVFAGLGALVLTLILPTFLSAAMGAYLFYAQHNFPGVTFSDCDGWTYEKAAMESSSCLKTGALVGWFTANIGYHHVHHLNSKIPFYRLPEAQRGIPELQSPKTTSLHPIEIARCLRLKVWDTDAQRMIGLKELAA